MTPSKLSEETIEKIRKLVRDGKSGSSVAKETGFSVGAVCKYTKDLRNHNEKISCIRGKEVGVLKKILRKGYALPREGGNILLKLASEASDD